MKSINAQPVNYYAGSSLGSNITLTDAERKLGRRLTSAPWLSRILYIPKHDNSTTNLPLYDVSEEYRRTVGDQPIGTSLSKVNLQLMKKPTGNGTDDVQYLIDFDEPRVMVVTRRTLTEQTTEMMISLSPEPNDGFKIKTPYGEVPVKTSFPIAPTYSGRVATRNPYFTFSVPTSTGDLHVQWQVHPQEHGLERYTLVKASSSPEDGIDATPIAIYHHVGIALSLSQAPIEGVLCLPPNNNPALESLIVASMLGMLWQLQRMGGGYREQSRRRFSTEIEEKKRHSVLGRWYRKHVRVQSAFSH